MKLSNLKVRTRLIAGFGLLLLTALFIGGLGGVQLGGLHSAVVQLSTEDWNTARGAITLRSNLRSVGARSAEYLLADEASRPAVLEKLNENRKAIEEGIEKLSKLDTEDTESVNGLAKVAEDRTALLAVASRVTELGAVDKSRSEATRVSLDELRPLVDTALTDAQALVKMHEADFMRTAELTRVDYERGRNVTFITLGLALALGLLSAVF